jgi:hypothetical protein
MRACCPTDNSVWTLLGSFRTITQQIESVPRAAIHSNIQLLRRQPFYKGVIRYKGLEYPGRHDVRANATSWSSRPGTHNARSGAFTRAGAQPCSLPIPPGYRKPAVPPFESWTKSSAPNDSPAPPSTGSRTAAASSKRERQLPTPPRQDQNRQATARSGSAHCAAECSPGNGDLTALVRGPPLRGMARLSGG